MRAIILAAGMGLRLVQPEGQQKPKCLLRFGDASLLERHLQLLKAAGVDEIVFVLGFKHEQVEAELASIDWKPATEVVVNGEFSLGSVLSVHTAAEALTRGGDVLLMDADVLYDERILEPLVANGHAHVNRLLIDRDFEAGDEPVKLCVDNGVPVELRKQVAAGLKYDTIGESVGFFRFDEHAAKRLAEIVADYVATGRANLPHEEAVRDLLLEKSHVFDIADVTGAPWIEIDFQNDVTRAADEVLPQLHPACRSTATERTRTTSRPDYSRTHAPARDAAKQSARIHDGGAQRLVRAHRRGSGLQGDLGLGPVDLRAVRRARQQRSELDAGGRHARIHGRRERSADPARRRHRLRQLQQRAAAREEARAARHRRRLHRGQAVPEDQQLHQRRGAAARRHRRVLRQDQGGQGRADAIRISRSSRASRR